MRAWVATKKGFTNLKLVTNYPLPSIQSEHDILIKNIALGINPVDYNRLIRSHPLFNPPPFIAGADGCGIVQEVGPKVDSNIFKPGKLVYYASNIYVNGCFADYSVQDSRGISVVPDKAFEGKSLQDAAITFASLPVASFTAYTNVCVKLGLPIFPDSQKSRIREYKNILVTGGSGGVGGFCLQLLTLWRKTLPESFNKDVKIITLCSPKNHQYVKDLGATHAIDYADSNVVQQILDITNQEGIDGFIDNTGGDTINWAFEVLNNGGDFVTNLPVPSDFDMNKLFFRSQNVHQTYLAYMYIKKLPYHLNELREIGDLMGNLVANGILKSTISDVIKFEDIKEQLGKTVRLHTKGKVVALV